MTGPENSPEGYETPDFPSVEQMIEVFRAVLPQDEIDDLMGMESVEAYEYLLVALPEFGIEDPESIMRAAGLIEGTRLHSEEEMKQMTRSENAGEEPHKADEMWGTPPDETAI